MSSIRRLEPTRSRSLALGRLGVALAVAALVVSCAGSHASRVKAAPSRVSASPSPTESPVPPTTSPAPTPTPELDGQARIACRYIDDAVVDDRRANDPRGMFTGQVDNGAIQAGADEIEALASADVAAFKSAVPGFADFAYKSPDPTKLGTKLGAATRAWRDYCTSLGWVSPVPPSAPA